LRAVGNAGNGDGLGIHAFGAERAVGFDEVEKRYAAGAQRKRQPVRVFPLKAQRPGITKRIVDADVFKYFYRDNVA
jgi:hypothetical protein